jgi:hypothetical protein
MQLFLWIITALLIALWSLLAWGVQALLGLGSGAGTDWVALVAQVPGAAWLEVWLPGWRDAAVFGAQSLSTVLGWIGGAGPIIVWVLWGLGTGAMLIGAALLSGLIAIARRAAGPRAAAA